MASQQDIDSLWQAINQQRERADAMLAQHNDLRLECAEIRSDIRSVADGQRHLTAVTEQYLHESSEWRRQTTQKLEEVTETRGIMRVLAWLASAVLAVGLMVAGWAHGGKA